MKQLILVFIAAAFLVSCGSQQTDKPTTPTTEIPQAKKPESKKVNSSEVFTSDELEMLANDGNSGKRGGKKNQVAPQVTVVTSTVSLTHNSGSSFTIDYGGATDVVYHFFRGGDSLSTVSGNVYPNTTQSVFTSDLTFTSNFTRTYYQSVVVFGSKVPDANGVVGADWVMVYSNVVNN